MKFSTVAIWLFLVVLALIGGGCWYVASIPAQPHITWGVDFSQMQAEQLHLDWKQLYLALLNDLEVKHLKLHTQWDWVQGDRNSLYFADIDWQLQQAREKGADVIYVVGLKSGRWPECHEPTWATTLSPEDQQKAVLSYITQVVNRYKDDPEIASWQVENEPLFKFGECPSWYYYDTSFLQTEVNLVKSLDTSRPVIISDTGEYSLWLRAAQVGDVVGTTLYRKVWVHLLDNVGFYFTLPLPPQIYGAKAKLVEILFHKPVINVELQAEPWTQHLFYAVPLSEQGKTMNPAQFQATVTYAKQTGLDEFYFWGPEWWYWMKTTQNQPQIWNYAKTLFQTP